MTPLHHAQIPTCSSSVRPREQGRLPCVHTCASIARLFQLRKRFNVENPLLSSPSRTVVVSPASRLAHEALLGLLAPGQRVLLASNGPCLDYSPGAPTVSSSAGPASCTDRWRTRRLRPGCPLLALMYQQNEGAARATGQASPSKSLRMYVSGPLFSLMSCMTRSRSSSSSFSRASAIFS